MALKSWSFEQQKHDMKDLDCLIVLWSPIVWTESLLLSPYPTDLLAVVSFSGIRSLYTPEAYQGKRLQTIHAHLQHPTCNLLICFRIGGEIPHGLPPQVNLRNTACNGFANWGTAINGSVPWLLEYRFWYLLNLSLAIGSHCWSKRSMPFKDDSVSRDMGYQLE